MVVMNAYQKSQAQAQAEEEQKGRAVNTSDSIAQLLHTNTHSKRDTHALLS